MWDFISNVGGFAEPTARYFFGQLLNGLYYCHSNNICHRDLKPENIMLTENFDLKMIDFGFASNLDKYGTQFLATYCGTPSYMAPELLLQNQYKGEIVDIFACGVILFIMVVGRPPFESASPDDNFYKCIASKNQSWHRKFWKAHGLINDSNQPIVSKQFMNLMINMFKLEPSERLSL